MREDVGTLAGDVGGPRGISDVAPGGEDRQPKTIPLTKGKFALVDAEDFVWLSRWKWCVSSTGYAVRGEGHGSVLMHRAILALSGRTEQADHVNGDRLDNRRCNLRKATNAQNGWNRPRRRDCRSGVKGAHLRRDGRWTAEIRANGNRIRLGYFKTAEAAGAAYADAAAKLHGEFARSK